MHLTTAALGLLAAGLASALPQVSTPNPVLFTFKTATNGVHTCGTMPTTLPYDRFYKSDLPFGGCFRFGTTIDTFLLMETPERDGCKGKSFPLNL